MLLYLPAILILNWVLLYTIFDLKRIHYTNEYLPIGDAVVTRGPDERKNPCQKFRLLWVVKSIFSYLTSSQSEKQQKHWKHENSRPIVVMIFCDLWLYHRKHKIHLYALYVMYANASGVCSVTFFCEYIVFAFAICDDCIIGGRGYT